MSENIEGAGWSILIGDVRKRLRDLRDGSVQTCITSPPYWGLRSYGTEPQVWGGDGDCEHSWGVMVDHHEERESIKNGKSRTTERFYGSESRKFDGNHQRHFSGTACSRCGAWLGELGNEPTPDLFIEHLIEVFREVRRVLRSDGTCWVNLGDSYSSGGRSTYRSCASDNKGHRVQDDMPRPAQPEGLKPKDMVCVPWMFAMAARADGWYLRSAMPWVKRNSMPDSATDRPGNAVEYVFLLSKSEKYFYDHTAVMRASTSKSGKAGGKSFGKQSHDTEGTGSQSRKVESREHLDVARNFRTGDLFFESLTAPHGMVSDEDGTPLALDVTTQSFHGAHFATFPEWLVRPMIAASTSERGCCTACGGPFTRTLKRTSTVSASHKGSTFATGKTGVSQHRCSKGDRYVSIPVGWEPTCRCSDAIFDQPSPCVVLDPFAGSGTTLKVARHMGRTSIGVELLPENAEIARQRIVERPGSKVVDALPGQMDLF